MKVSIITSVWNRRDSIEMAIKSVLNQDYDDIEYIVLDGNSDDGTIDIIKKYESEIATFVSEPDDGIYDGLNKAVSLATGDIIGFLHSDDVFASNTVISQIVSQFTADVDGVYSDLLYVQNNDEGKIVRKWQSRPFEYNLLAKGWMPPHPTLFLKRHIYQKFGQFDTSFQIAADYDFMLRIFSQNITTKYIPQFLYKMRVGGESNKNLKSIIQKSKEDFKALKRNKVGGIGTLLYKNLSKIKQFIFVS